MASKISLQRILRTNCLRTPEVFLAGDSVIWYSGSIMVADDPNLIEWFGDYLLRRLYGGKEDEKHVAFYLGVEKNIIKITGEIDFKDARKTKEYLDTKKTELVPACASEGELEYIGKSFRLKGCGVCVRGKPDEIFIADMDKFDYLRSISDLTNGIYMPPQSSKLDLRCILFFKEDKLRGVVGSSGCGSSANYTGQSLDKLLKEAAQPQ